MDAVLKRKWIEALRSGEYPQCKDALFNGTGYCCLGVRAKIEGLKIHPAASDDDHEENSEIYTKYGEELGETKNDLIRMNDEGYSFNDIADFIETIP